MVENVIRLTTSDTKLLSRVVDSNTLPEFALEKIAVMKGLAKEEGTIPLKDEFEEYIKRKKWEELIATDSRWQKQILLESRRYSKTLIKFYLKADFVLVDSDNSTVKIIICDFSSKSKEEVKREHREQAYVTRKVAKSIWKMKNIVYKIWQYDLQISKYSDKEWIFEQEDNNYIVVERGKQINFVGAIDIIEKWIPNVCTYNAKPIPYDELPPEAQNVLDDLKELYLYASLSIEALDRIKRECNFNRRRIISYLFEDSDLSHLKQKIDNFHIDFTEFLNNFLEDLSDI